MATNSIEVPEWGESAGNFSVEYPCQNKFVSPLGEMWRVKRELDEKFWEDVFKFCANILGQEKLFEGALLGNQRDAEELLDLIMHDDRTSSIYKTAQFYAERAVNDNRYIANPLSSPVFPEGGYGH